MSVTYKFEIADHKGYLTVGFYPDGKFGKIFIQMSKEGSTVATLTSIALQYGVPLEELVNKFAYQRFEPSGYTNNPDINRPVRELRIDPAPEANQARVKRALGTAYLGVLCSHCGSDKVIRAGAGGVCTQCGTSQGCS